MIDAMVHLLPDGGRRPLDMDEALAVEDILDAAAAVAADRLPWWEAAKQGAMPARDWRTGRALVSPAYGRFVALMVTPPSDPRRAALLALVDRLVRESGITLTQHGCFERDELAARGVVVKGAA